MKKLIVVLTTSLLLVGCGGDETKVIQGAPTNDKAGTQAQAEKTEKEEKEEPGKAVNLGYVFEYNGISVAMDALADGIISDLGEPISYFEAESCAFDGIDKVYTYNSFELETYPTDGKDFISLLVFKDDTVTTPEGIGIGDTATRVLETYGQTPEEGGMLVYKKGDMKLCFIVHDDEVVSVEYRSKVLDEQ